MTPGRCYAFGPGLVSPVPIGVTARLTVVACDVTGTRRLQGGDDFKVTVSPKAHAHHLEVRTTISDNHDGSYGVCWKAPFSGVYLIHISLCNGRRLELTRLPSACCICPAPWSTISR